MQMDPRLSMSLRLGLEPPQISSTTHPIRYEGLPLAA